MSDLSSRELQDDGERIEPTPFSRGRYVIALEPRQVPGGWSVRVSVASR